MRSVKRKLIEIKAPVQKLSKLELARIELSESTEDLRTKSIELESAKERQKIAMAAFNASVQETRSDME
jgi:hypothetical protein